jgi:hypothetical protein
MVTPTGEHVRPLERGEWKALANHRTRLVGGDPEAVATVRRIFDLFDRAGLGVPAMVASLTPRPPAEGGQSELETLGLAAQALKERERKAGG